MTPALRTAAVSYFKAHEGFIPWLYCDVVALPTVGVGFMIGSAKAMKDYAFLDRVSGTTATDQEKETEWEAIRELGLAALAKAKGDVKKMPNANYYRPYTTMDLPDADIERLLVEKLETFDRQLVARFPRLFSAPLNAHLGVLDMIYSLGFVGLTRNWPNFCGGVDRSDWATCAAECERAKVSKSRNADLKALFLSAVPTRGIIAS